MSEDNKRMFARRDFLRASGLLGLALAL